MYTYDSALNGIFWLIVYSTKNAALINPNLFTNVTTDNFGHGRKRRWWCCCYCHPPLCSLVKWLGHSHGMWFKSLLWKGSMVGVFQFTKNFILWPKPIFFQNCHQTEKSVICPASVMPMNQSMISYRTSLKLQLFKTKKTKLDLASFYQKEGEGKGEASICFLF